MQALAERPPYIRFEKRPVEVRDGKLEKTGIPSYTDVDFVCVTSPGSKDEWAGVAEDWFARKKKDVLDGRFPAEWLNAFTSAYEMWKRDEEPPVMGTALAKWPGITPSQYKMLRDIRVLTVEDVAAMNEDTLNRLGMGGRALKDRAAAWLEAAVKGAPAERLVSLEQERDELKAQVARLSSQIQGLTAQIASQGNNLGARL